MIPNTDLVADLWRHPVPDAMLGRAGVAVKLFQWSWDVGRVGADLKVIRKMSDD